MDPTRFETLTRRQFVNLVGKAGGFGAAYLVMQGLGLLPDDLAHASPPELEPGSGSGSSVAILGAGLAGLTAAHLLGKAGYDCYLLESRERAGGRCWTLRRGDSVEERGRTKQVCEFNDGLYFNPGPARIYVVETHLRRLAAYSLQRKRFCQLGSPYARADLSDTESPRRAHLSGW